MFQQERARKLIQDADIVSFDVFDTLLFRIVSKPEDIFEIMESVLKIKNFSEIRQKSQEAASMAVKREKGIPHADFDEIYQYLLKHHTEICNWNDVKTLEFQMERDSLVANPEMKELFQFALNCGKKVIITSDMYFTQKEMRFFLQKNGLDNYDRLYVSSDVHKTKYEGDLYKWIAEEEKVAPNKILHIGDNYQSDIINAQKAGWTALYYDREQPQKEIGQLAAMKCLQYKEDDFWHKLGGEVGGPLYLGIYCWMKDKLRKKSYDKVFLMSRDGYTLYRICQKTGVNNVEYLYTSRRALLLGGITQLDEISLELLPPFTSGQTIREIFEYLKIDVNKIQNLESCGFDSIEDEIISIEDRKNIKKLYCYNDKLILERCTFERECAKKYFSSVGMLSCRKALFFDSGWNGSSQFLLDRLLKAMESDIEGEFIYIGIQNSDKSRKQLKNKKYETYLFDIEKNQKLQRKIMSSVVIFELFFGAPHNSVLFYDDKGYVLENLESSNEIKEQIIEGILEYLKLTAGFSEKYKLNFNEKEVLRPLERLIDDPTEKEAMTIGNLQNVDGFVASKNKKQYLAYLTLKDYMKNPKTEIYWLQGFFKRPDINPFLKKILAKKFGIDYHFFKVAQKQKINVHTLEIGRQNEFLNDIKKEKGVAVYNCIKQQLEKEKEFPDYSYQKWIEQNEWDKNTINPLGYEPLISIVIPVYNVTEDQLTECIESILNQTYKNWELILVDDCSTWECVFDVLKKYENRDKVTVIYRETNGHISEATNTGLEIVKGEFVAFCDCDDVIAVNALYEFVKALNTNPDVDFLYSDEDKLSEDGKKRHSPFFKPDWSPDTFMSIMYTNHLALYRTELVRKTGGLRSAFNGAQDYDFTLRFMELSNNKRVCHIPKVLYYWRERGESLAAGAEAKPYALEAVRKAKEEALKRRGWSGTVEYVNSMSQYRVVYKNDSNPLVSIIIPSKDHANLLKQCISTILEYTKYPNFEFIVVDNGSCEEQRKEIEDYLADKQARYYYQKMEFNFSKMCNIGASHAKGEYFLFLNDDIENFQEDWLGRMVGQASLEHVGAVGAKLYYPETSLIQHAGVINAKIGPSHVLGKMDDMLIYYFGRNRMDYNFLALTGACLMIRKSLYTKCQGFNEKLTVAYNDIDLCMKLYEMGYYNVLRNDVILYHHESVSRGYDAQEKAKKDRLQKEYEYLCSLHPDLYRRDPFYSINLTGYKTDYSIRIPEMDDSNVNVQKNMILPKESNTMEVVIDSARYFENVLTISGWGFEKSINNNNDGKKFLLLEAVGKEKIIIPCEDMYRQDVANAFKNDANGIEICGFKAQIPSDYISPTFWDYQISLILKIGESIYWKNYGNTLNTITNPKDTLDISEYWVEQRIIPSESENVLSEIVINEENESIKLTGWIFCKNNDRHYVKRIAFILPDGQVVLKPVKKEQRMDVAAFFYAYPHISESGFECIIDKSLLRRMSAGTRCGILMINKYNNESLFKEISGVLQP